MYNRYRLTSTVYDREDETQKILPEKRGKNGKGQYWSTIDDYSKIISPTSGSCSTENSK